MIPIAKMKQYLSKDFLVRVVCHPAYFGRVSLLFILAEVVINTLIIHNIKYTEIDWVAYMQEVEGVANGTWDYTELRGDTGPLVYPAGQRAEIPQKIAEESLLPPYVLLVMCCTSYRVHSILVLRLFNDSVAMVFLFGAMNLFIDNHWALGSLVYSLAVSIKMNILLFAPALLLAYLRCLGLWGTVKQLVICASVQLALGAPFLIANPVGYIRMAFDLGRVFLFEWTVNWRFLPEEVFLSPLFHLLLLSLHLALLALFAYTHGNKFLTSYSNLILVDTKLNIKSQLFILPMFLCNFIGMAVSRSLHYQFYIWYYHSLPYLLWSTPYRIRTRFLLLGVIELCWNTYPSTWWSSLLLHACHLAILVGVYLERPKEPGLKKVRQMLDKKKEK
ncbi:Dol-P-Man:Man(5)GlcNAc(2)-PP-Dol alpha-1,3-mannosyltransferase [Chionoecetes opilio]|uniref:dolichyl-P-Man:Man5GlcNAc2-PP-dolichol alpha-1,3-mannosyltransferase n=1 Tax=Chionoecetes opilio TaxID=41210 RepID=A0A8J5CGN3_CHIOP|nr:Dol-P-Man:Man(5)GlcNAc(2)-PP-Dol alpha-1,3-mannosyltransferase [Chionoecetes opilio]